MKNYDLIWSLWLKQENREFGTTIGYWDHKAFLKWVPCIILVLCLNHFNQPFKHWCSAHAVPVLVVILSDMSLRQIVISVGFQTSLDVIVQHNHWIYMYFEIWYSWHGQRHQYAYKRGPYTCKSNNSRKTANYAYFQHFIGQRRSQTRDAELWVFRITVMKYQHEAFWDTRCLQLGNFNPISVHRKFPADWVTH